MVSIKFKLQNLISKDTIETKELFFTEWNEEVEILLERNRNYFEETFPNYRVFTIIVNEEKV